MSTVIRQAKRRLPSGGVHSAYKSNWLWSVVLTSAVVAWALIDPVTRHWFLIPVAISGMLIGIDAVRWVRGRIDIFDPIGIVGMMGLQLFLFAPILHIKWDAWRPFHQPVEIEWLARMAVINAAGLLLYRISCHVFRPRATDVKSSIRLPNSEQFQLVMFAGLIITLVAQIGAYAKFGGIDGIIAAYEDRASGSLVGMGWIFMIGESFPIVAFIAWAFHKQRKNRIPSWFYLLMVLILFFGLRILFGGIRGSRSNTIWAIFWAVGIIHFRVRPVPKRYMYLGLVLTFVFMLVYSPFKEGGADGFRRYLMGGVIEEFQTGKVNARVEKIILADLSRVDHQARVLRGLMTPSMGYELALGRSYLGDVAILIPRQIWPNRPPKKGYYGSQAMYGRFVGRQSSTPFGITGEAMLNFGVPGGVLSFVVFGLLVSAVRRFIVKLSPGDIRWVLLPLLINACIIVLVSDLDNTIFFFVKNGAVPIALVYAGSTVVRRPVRISDKPAEGRRSASLRAKRVGRHQPRYRFLKPKSHF